MMRCSDHSLAYVVVSEGGVGGIGERLHALDPDEIAFKNDEISCDLDLASLQRRSVLTPEAWPKSIEAAA
jgi:hypothetical protein